MEMDALTGPISLSRLFQFQDGTAFFHAPEIHLFRPRGDPIMIRGPNEGDIHPAISVFIEISWGFTKEDQRGFQHSRTVNRIHHSMEIFRHPVRELELLHDFPLFDVFFPDPVGQGQFIPLCRRHLEHIPGRFRIQEDHLFIDGQRIPGDFQATAEALHHLFLGDFSPGKPF